MTTSVKASHFLAGRDGTMFGTNYLNLLKSAKIRKNQQNHNLLYYQIIIMTLGGLGAESSLALNPNAGGNKFQ